MKNIVTGIIGAIKEVIFPNVCIICRKASEKPVCAHCVGKLILSHGEKSELHSLFEGDVYCMAKYTGPFKETFRDYKFKGEIWLGKRFAELIAIIFENTLKAENYDFITYVPVSGDGIRSRGFDQCEEIVRPLGRITGVEIKETVVTSSLKKTQSKLDRRNRMANVRGKFKMGERAESVEGKRILLFDDILTTGATLKEISDILYENGAVKVDALVAATGRADGT